jgi:transcriptional regulator with XRE-family HTH domain
MHTFAERLAKAMDGRKQVGLARACGVTSPSVNQWLSGETKRIDGVHLIKACDFLGVHPRWLVLGEGPMMGREPEVAKKVDLPELVVEWLKQCRPDLL